MDLIKPPVQVGLMELPVQVHLIEPPVQVDLIKPSVVLWTGSMYPDTTLRTAI